jgi:hypothetical protein
MQSASEEQQLIYEIGSQIDWYSTAILRLSTDPDDRQPDHQVGSGTFVSVEGRYGILTAHHVAAQLLGHCSLGLILMQEVHRFAIEENHFVIWELAVPSPPSTEPDLAFIEVFGPDIGSIKARKQFWPLSTVRQKMLDNAPALNSGVWFVWGVPAEDTTSEPAEKGYSQIRGLHSQCSATHASREDQAGEHDYIEIEVEYGKEFHVPQSFGGYSGGGIWQVFLKTSETGRFLPAEFILSGVAFYQTEISDQKRYLRCHGRRSIYGYVYDRLKRASA